jgi:chorismate mutase
MKVAQKIGEYKKNNDITILQTNRWNEILDRAVSKGNKLEMDLDHRF